MKPCTHPPSYRQVFLTASYLWCARCGALKDKHSTRPWLRPILMGRDPKQKRQEYHDGRRPKAHNVLP